MAEDQVSQPLADHVLGTMFGDDGNDVNVVGLTQFAPPKSLDCVGGHYTADEKLQAQVYFDGGLRQVVSRRNLYLEIGCLCANDFLPVP
jgi:hypothetical protein